MTEIRSRVLLAGLTALLVGFALVNMVVDRRALAQGGRELSWWSGLALDVAVRDGRIRTGQCLMLVGVGGGFTWGSVFLRWT